MSYNENQNAENPADNIIPENSDAELECDINEDSADDTAASDNLTAADEEFADVLDTSADDDENDGKEELVPDYDSLNSSSDNDTGLRRSAKLKADLKTSEKKRRLSKKAKKNIAIASALVLSAAAIIYIIGIVTIPKNKVMRNVYIENIHLGGMSYEKSLEVITRELMLNDISIPISCNGSSFVIRGAEIGMTASPVDTAKRAFNYGKSGNTFIDGFQNALSIFKKHRIMPAAKTDRELLVAKINEFGISLYGEMQEHLIEPHDAETMAYVHPGHTGYNPNDPESYNKAADLVMAAIDNNRYGTINVSLRESSPQNLTIEMLDKAIYTDPVNAQFVIEGNNVTVSPEVNGRYINKEEAAAYLPGVYEGGDIIKIPYSITPAEITKPMLEEKLFANILSTFSTSYRGSTADRSKNVSRASSLINGKVLAPGDIFSFNDTVGKRTAANGFFPATEYVNGESVQGIGGGTCQVSTTLYSAALYADLQIVNRKNHVMTVGYVPLGQDATVADDSIDFKFKNTTDYPIKINSHTDGSSIYVSIIGTAWNPERRVELKHTTSMSGEDTVVNSTRYVYEGDNLISTDSLGQSYYKPHKEKTEDKPKATQSPQATAADSAAVVQEGQ